LKKSHRKIPAIRKNQTENYRLLQDLMDHVPDVIYFKDLKGRLLLVNKAHAKGLGLRPEQVAGKSDFDFFPEERAEMMAKDDQRVFKSGKPIIDKIERATRADGIDNYVSTTKIPRFDAKGRVIGLIGITRDITKRMQIARVSEEEKVLKKRLESLEELNRLKSEFISVVSHELRTPLAIVKEGVNLIYEGLAGGISEKQKKLLSQARENIERLKKLIDDLLDLSRIEAGRVKLSYSLVNLSDLLRNSAEFFQKQARDKEITLKYDLPRERINIFLDGERINQVVSNLISNAIKFTEEGGRVTVELQALENKIRIGVIDTGIGIAKHDIPKLFSRFTQLSKDTGTARKGMGLGLSIAKELVELHGGEIWAESKPGVGSKFYFTIPRYYSIRVLDEFVRRKVNELLTQGLKMHLINFLFIDYKEFVRHLKVKPTDLFSALRAIIEAALGKLLPKPERRRPYIHTDASKGECSIILPEITEKSALKVCALLKAGLDRYLTNNKFANAFIAMGLLSYTHKIRLKERARIPARVFVKEMYVGSEMRKHRRINYKATVEIICGNKQEESRTIDISEGGICFSAKCPLKTDAVIKTKLKIAKDKILHLKGRVAWVREEQKDFYRMGLQFLSVNPKTKKALSRFIRAISRARSG